MKTLSFTILVIALLGLMVYTNPSANDFKFYVQQHISQEIQKDSQDPVGQVLGSIMGGIAGGLASTQAIRDDYVFFSVYTLQWGQERLRAVGVFRNFFLLDKPDWPRQGTAAPNAG
ncbi:MAG: DUF4359 domain-containing protein [Syntrophobacteraceae bacterium]